MIFTKSVKQFLRMPVTAALFVVLFAAAAFFVSSGTVIWARNQATIKAYESVFVTIGTVRQQPDSFDIKKTWDATTKSHTQRSVSTWSVLIPPSVLDFDGADYVIPPERRPFYGALRPDLALEPNASERYIGDDVIMEFTPLEDCVPDHPVEVRIIRVLNENTRKVHRGAVAGQIDLVYEPYNESPQPLYSGRTYLMYASGFVYDLLKPMAWVPGRLSGEVAVDFSTQYHPDGTLVEGDITPPSIREVTEGFYETEEGRRWLEYAHALLSFQMIMPVQPTNGTELLLPFYNGEANILDGEDITPEEYVNGDRVCLIPENFASRNGLSVGDTLQLPLIYANYRYAPGYIYVEQDPGFSIPLLLGSWWEIASPLKADGEMYNVFSDHEYIIKGIYSCGSYTSDDTISMGANTVVIPSASVRESDADNIIDYGPMRDTTTSFRIPNGSIEVYMEKWLAQGIDGLEITFHDRGYTQLHRGLENMKRVATLFLAIGAAMSVALVFFFCNVFITKNRMRTAVERMLGFTKRQCAASLLTAFLLAAVIATAAGCAVGAYAEKRISDSVTLQPSYNTTYTVGPLGEKGSGLEETEISSLYAPAAGIALLVMTVLVSALFMRGNVKKEPLQLLGGTDA